MMILFMILFVLWLAFAWPIGGEKYFGRSRRGWLLLPAIIVHGLVSGMPWYYYVAQAGLAWGIYQALFYDDCIKMIWPDSGDWASVPWWGKGIGWAGLTLNGLLISAQPVLFWVLRGKCLHAGLVALALMVAFPLACVMSNDWKASFPYCERMGGVKILCPADSWWLACMFVGFVLGLCFVG